MRRDFTAISTSSSLVALALLALLLAGAYLAYREGLSGPFLLDDASNIAPLASDTLTWQEVRDGALWGSSSGAGFRSLTFASFTLTQVASGYDPYAFKYQNLLLHLINGLLVFWLTLLLAPLRGARVGLGAPAFALAVTAIWLVHPLQVTTVLYVVQRLVLLSTLFVLLALITYVKGRTLAVRRPVAGALVAAGGVGGFGLLGLLSKENASLIPVYVLLIEFFFFRFATAGAQYRRVWRLVFAVLVVVPLSAAALFTVWRFPSLTAAYSGRDFTLGERLLTQLHALWLYLTLYAAPVPGAMSLFHDGFPVQRAIDVPTVALGMLYAALVGVAIALRRRLPIVGFGIALFSACHALESTFLPLEMVFEHRNYLAILGLTLVAVGLVELAAGSPRGRKGTMVLLAGLALLFGLNTARVALVWGDERRLLETEYQARPESPRVVFGMIGLALGRNDLAMAGRLLGEYGRLGVPDASPQLLTTMLMCGADAVPAQVHEMALHRIRQGILSPLSINLLNTLVESHLAGQCRAVTIGQLDALTVGATTNPRSHVRVGPCQAYLVRAKLHAGSPGSQIADRVFAETFGRCVADMPARCHDVVNELTRIATVAGRQDELRLTLDELHARCEYLESSNL